MSLTGQHSTLYLCLGLVFGVLLLTLLALAPTAGRSEDLPVTATPEHHTFLPLVGGPPPPRVLIAAAYIDSARPHEPDEALLLWNIGPTRLALAGWRLESGARQVTVPLTVTLALEPGQRLWCAAEATAFLETFGELPACEWGADSQPAVPNLDGSLTLPNPRGVIRLLGPDDQLVDVLVYGDEPAPAPGWQGLPAQLYTRGVAAASGQVWQRKRDVTTSLPVDTDRAADWAGDLADLTWGRRIRLPGWSGWDAATLLQPATGQATATVITAVGPEGLYQPIAERIAAAAATIDLSIYTLEHPNLTQLLADAARRGVRVRVLLDGGPPGGITPLQKWCVRELAAAGGEVRYLAVRSDAPAGYKKRYRYTHAKFGVIDSRLALVGTENFNRDAMPLPSAAPVGGRRGFYVLTDAPPVVAALQQIFAGDWAPERFFDLRLYDPVDPKYGDPPPDFVLPPASLYPVTTAPFAAPLVVTGNSRFAVASAPENALRPDTGLHALIARAGPGDEIVAMQLYENKHWGATTSNPIADPNLRLQALIDAARRGATVRLLLDSFFDDPDDLRSNRATVEYVRTVASQEQLPLAARVGNPTLGGIHAKMMLLRLGDERWSALGSLNGGEVSHKLNREVLLLLDEPTTYARLHTVFEHDWLLGE